MTDKTPQDIPAMLYSAEDYAHITALLFDGRPAAQIARRLEIPKVTHYYYLKHGIKDAANAKALRKHIETAATALRARARALEPFTTH